KPADTALREAFKRLRLAPFDAAEMSRVVFAYYRWRGWLENEKDLKAAIQHTPELARRFRSDPSSISLDALQAKDAPDWIATEVESSDEWLKPLQQERKLWLRARRGQGSVLAQKLGGCRAFGNGLLADSLEYTGETDLFRTPEFHAGEFELQD